MSRYDYCDKKSMSLSAGRDGRKDIFISAELP